MLDPPRTKLRISPSAVSYPGLSGSEALCRLSEGYLPSAMPNRDMVPVHITTNTRHVSSKYPNTSDSSMAVSGHASWGITRAVLQSFVARSNKVNRLGKVGLSVCRNSLRWELPKLPLAKGPKCLCATACARQQ